MRSLFSKTLRGLVAGMIALSLNLPTGQAVSAGEVDTTTERLVELLGVREQLAHTATELTPLVRHSARQVAADYAEGASRDAHYAAIKSQLKEFISEVISWDQLGPVYVEAYRTVYSEEEIGGLVAFFESPLGKRYLEEQPRLTTLVDEALQDVIPVLMRGLEAEIASFREKHPADEGAHSCAACCAKDSQGKNTAEEKAAR